MNDQSASDDYSGVTLPVWRDVLRSQGRSLRWLATATATNYRTVLAYSAWRPGMSRTDHGRRPTDRWLRRASVALDREVGRE